MTDTTETPEPGVEPVVAASLPARPGVWRRAWFPYALFLPLGLLTGAVLAIYAVRAEAMGGDEQIGAWTTGRDYATAEQSAKTRAVVALRGILALPAAEARYYTASVDDAGQPLTRNCTYRLTGGTLPVQFWTITLYDGAGYLVKNDANLFSTGNVAMPLSEQARWQIIVSPVQQPGRWLPTGGGGDGFQLTLRAYLPADGGKGNFAPTQLPAIRREACR